MPRFWLSGPRLFNGLIRPGISFSGRELPAWCKRVRQGRSETASAASLSASGVWSTFPGQFAEVMALRMRLGSVMHLGSETKQEAAQNYA